jgi:hypothetical protein
MGTLPRRMPSGIVGSTLLNSGGPVLGGGRDPVAISCSVSMKEVKGTPSPKPDKGAIRQAGKARRAFLALRERLRQFAEARRSPTLPVDRPALLDEDARALSELGWGSADHATGASGSGGGSPGGGPPRNTRPPAITSFARAARFGVGGALMASFLGGISGDRSPRQYRPSQRYDRDCPQDRPGPGIPL